MHISTRVVKACVTLQLSANMDYSQLPLSRMQIRLVTIEPALPEMPDGPVRCRMEVRNQHLPTSATIADSGMLPPNHISFDDYVRNLPNECFGAALRRDVGKIEENLEKKPSLVSEYTEKAVNKMRSRAGLGTSTREDIMIPVDDIVDLLTRDDLISMSEDIGNGFNMSIRRYESGPKRFGKLPLKDLNPFFRTRKPAKEDIDPDNYVALSYSWGPENSTQTIFINDLQVEVRENLALALKRFRSMAYFKNGGKIWIDALCINQNDEAEKQSQIAMMSMIYNLAGNIIVWLGEEGDGSNWVIDYLQKWSTFYRIEYIEAFDGSDPVTATTWRNMAQLRLRTINQQLLAMRQQLDVDLSDAEALSLYRFFERPYWRRLWIIQELAMGRAGMPVVCGDRVTQWRYIRDGLLFHVPMFGRLREAAQSRLARDSRLARFAGKTGTYQGGEGKLFDDDPLRHVSQIAQLEISGHRRRLPAVDRNELPIYTPAIVRDGPLYGSSLRQALLLSSRALCFKPHDRVYGMLSIPCLPVFEVEVNYSKPVGHVFMEFTTACVRNQSLDFFSMVDGVGLLPTGEDCSSFEDRAGCMPSWVPNYAAVPERRISLIDGDWKAGGETGGRFPFFSSFPTHQRCVPPAVQENKLICTGRIVDQIAGIGAVSKADLDTGILDVLGPEAISVKQSTNPSSTETPVEEILHHVLVGGCHVSGDQKPVSQGFKCLYTAFPANEPTPECSGYRNWHFLNSSANLIIHGRRLSSYFTFEEAKEAQENLHDEPSNASNLPSEDRGMGYQDPYASSEDSDSSSEYGRTTTNQSLKGSALQAMEARTKMRRLVITKSGLLGLAPLTTQVGDAVLIVVGYGKPMVAKPVTVVENRAWRVRGEAYVHGMMRMERMPLNTTKPELMIASDKDLGLEELTFV
ncbi:HET-domain-containing protein [Sporormia fimetaria CBS 119925]|uniref:HET-domain-containing protein n=1 Tax=Sporormia fimetaria CBS 119925 TaxID=1340428 RepID=A0A6A6UX51_9PLEO|nr:HET-domain-containing protein [Sporormia fimetaria CBS 119925]